MPHRRHSGKRERGYGGSRDRSRASNTRLVTASSFHPPWYSGGRGGEGALAVRSPLLRLLSLMARVKCQIETPARKEQNTYMTQYSGESLRGYGREAYLRDRFKCQYCGFDGRDFLGWMQLSVDHIVPRGAGGADDLDNLATCCHSCNSITSRMNFAPATPKDEIIRQKIQRVRSRHQECLEFWKANVVQTYLREIPPAQSESPIRSAVL